MSLEMRPRFRLVVQPEIDETMKRILKAFDTPESHCYVDTYDKQFEIRVRKEHHHFWSPELNLIFTRDEEGTHLRGKFGPGAHVWTAFMGGYAAFGLLALGGGLLAMSQAGLGEDPTGLGLVVFGAVGCVLVYVAAQVGQRLAGPQIAVIRRAIWEAFPEAREE